VTTRAKKAVKRKRGKKSIRAGAKPRTALPHSPSKKANSRKAKKAAAKTAAKTPARKKVTKAGKPAKTPATKNNATMSDAENLIQALSKLDWLAHIGEEVVGARRIGSLDEIDTLIADAPDEFFDPPYQDPY